MYKCAEAKCISTEEHDQKNVKPLINISVFLLGGVLNEARSGKRKEEH